MKAWKPMSTAPRDGNAMSNVAMHPSAALAAFDAEAAKWAEETNLAGMIAKMSSDPFTRKKLDDFARLCFVEGCYRGACNVIDRKSLDDSIGHSDDIDKMGA